MTDNLDGQVTLSDLGIWCGKMSPEPLVPTKEKTSRQSSLKSSKSANRMPLYLCLTRDGTSQDASWETDSPLLGEYTMHSFGESPKEENESHLSQILEVSAHRKYYLSARACLGILNRAERRGKELPKELKEALIRQANLLSNPEVKTDVPECIGGGITPTLNTASGGQRQPCVICLQGNGIDRADTAGCNGRGWNDEGVSYTLNTIDRPAVMCMNDQGVARMDVTQGITATIRSQMTGHPPLVLCKPETVKE